MKILCLDIAYLMGCILVDYDLKTKKVKILSSEIVNVKNKKDHKEYYLHKATVDLIERSEPNLILVEEQFYRDMFAIKGIVFAAIPPQVEKEQIFSKRARNLAFDDGSLSKEDANDLIVKRYPELKGKIADILDAMILFEAWRIAFETGQPLKAPKKPVSKRPKVKKETKPKKQKATKPKTKKEKPKR